MGTLLNLETGTATTIDRWGVFVVHERYRLKRLSLGAPASLYLSVVGDVTERTASGGAVPPGVYQVSGTYQYVARRRGQDIFREAAFPERYLVVEPSAARFVTEAEVLRALGGCEALLALGLGDAAISLELGDVTNARYQWLRARDGR
jgi:hypothetical protein